MLSQSKLRFDIPVSDLSRAKNFYAERLGLVSTYDNEFCAQYRS
jgi:predicted enzyme related to lactoylglutathione lyase